MNKKYTTNLRLSFDVTRRCNMKCEFCAKGDAQNQDITEQIIDKTFDEVQNFAIGTLRLFGGEPFLCPNIINYIFDQIIKRGLMVGCIYINTNGTIRNDNIRNSLIKISKYFLKNKNNICNVFSNEYLKVKGVEVVVSTIGHNIANEEIEKTLAYYNTVNEVEFICKRDVDIDRNSLNNARIAIQGNAEKNHIKLLKNRQLTLSDIRIRNNKYNFIWNFNYNENTKFEFDTYVSKTLTVSTEGSVYVGCSAPWNEISKEAIFNINHCNGDFFKRIDDYCWKYPVNYKIKQLREYWEAIEWCKSHGYELNAIDDTVANTFDFMVKWTHEHEAQAIEAHKQFPFLNHNEIDIIISAKMPLLMQMAGCTDDLIKFYMSHCTTIPQNIIDTYNNTVGKEYLDLCVCDARNRALKDIFKIFI